MAHRGHEPVSFAVEGIVDQAVVLKLFEASGVASGTPYVCDGIGNLRQRLDGFNAGAHYSPWFVLCDLDRHDCAPGLRGRLFGTMQAERMELRVAVRAVEAWLMADRRDFASFLGVRVKRIPREPERIADPKQAVVDLARESTRRVIREGLPPSEAGGRRVGPAYTDEVIRYVRHRCRRSGPAPSPRVWRGCSSDARRSRAREHGRRDARRGYHGTRSRVL